MEILAATELEHRLLPAGAILALAVVAAVASRRLRLPVLITPAEDEVGRLLRARD